MNEKATNALEISQHKTASVSYRADLRPPEVAFGRCAITGEWGKVVSVDLGNLAIDAPNTEKGVEYDPSTGQVNFTVWDPVVFHQQLTVSRRGLEMLMAFMDSQESPIPAVTPSLVYQWAVMYQDGSVITQFEFNLEDATESEQHSGVIKWDQVQEFRLLPRGVGNDTLPQYTYVPSSGIFYKNGSPIDTLYDSDRPQEAQTVYCRQNTITMGSVLKPGSLNRALQLGHVTVLQCIGWCVGGINNLGDASIKKCLICVDERGNWRPWKYSE